MFVALSNTNKMTTNKPKSPVRVYFAPFKATLKNIEYLTCAHIVACKKTTAALIEASEKQPRAPFIFAN